MKIFERNKNAKYKSNNICIVISDLYSDFGGLEKQAIHLANFLSNFFNIYVFYRRYPSNKTIKELFSDNIRFVSFKARNDIINILDIRKILLNINPDCLIAMYSWNEAEIWTNILKNTGIPLFYSEHNDPQIIIQRWCSKQRKKVLSLADKIRVQWEDFIEYEFKNKTVIIGNGIEKFKGKTKYSDNTILYVGRLNDETKNTSYLIKSFNNLNKQDWKLVLYGKSFINTNNLPYNIEYKGFCLDNDVIYNNITFLCIPSIYEGWPNVVLESLNRNIPVLGYKHCSGVNRLVINNVNGFLYENLENSLKYIMENPQHITNLRENCQSTIDKYDMNTIHELWYKNIKEMTFRKNDTVMDSYE